MTSNTSDQFVIPRAEHPRPDRMRENWLSLNGKWEFEIDERADGRERGLTMGHALDREILVPFCPESPLSGIGYYDLMKNVWYRRFFSLPATMSGKRLLLHFGAVDYKATVYLNGEFVGEHIGGNSAFHFEITPFLKDGENEVVVEVFDDTASGLQPTGKQTHTVSEGCLYTRTTGIWQSVWLEAVGSSYIGDFNLTPDPDGSRVLMEISVNGEDPNLTLVAEAFADGVAMGSEKIPALWRNNRIVLNLKEKRLWTPESPFLYDLSLTLRSNGAVIDTVSSYFGLRKVEISGEAILINGKRIFQRLILDQGFYPDGIWTAPSDEELRRDIERSQSAGYNGARLHQKVFEPRFLYWADKLGYLIWGEYPNWGYNNTREGYSDYIHEWTDILVRDRNHPSIIGWCPFNETPPSAGELQRIVCHITKVNDPTRPVIETSGWTHTLSSPEVRDDHDYNQYPTTFRERWMHYFEASSKGGLTPASRLRNEEGKVSTANWGTPFMVSEFGGTHWAEKETGEGWGYGDGPRNLEEFYQRYQGLVDALLDNPHMFGFCYTQLTDVEQEHNGLYYYDRRPKFDMDRIKAITSRKAAYEEE